MKPAECDYIEKYWVPKEKQLVRVYTASYPNLNCFSTQRDEGMHPMVKTVLNHQLRLDEAVQRLAVEMKLAVERLQELEQRDRASNRRLLQANEWYLIKEHVASWALMKVLDEYTVLDSLKRTNQLLDLPCTCTLVERFGLPCRHYLERGYDEVIPLPLTLVHSRWWYAAGVESRAGWRPSYRASTQSRREILRLKRPLHEIVDATNELLQYRQSLNQERQQRLDEAHVQATRSILHEAQRREDANLLAPQILPQPIQTTWNQYAKSHDKASKRMLTGAEAAERDADRDEATVRIEERLQLQRGVEAEAAEASIDNELLTGIEAAAAELEADSEGSEVAEVVFCTPISPPQGLMLPPARSITPETASASHKRTLTLVMRTPDRPRAAPVPISPSIPFVSKAQYPHSTAPEAHEVPISTAPARLDGRVRREGKNSAYIRAMSIERGRGRGRQRRGGRA